MQRRRVEEVHAATAIASFECVEDGGYRQGRRVGGQDSVARHDGLERRKQVLLEGEALGSGLDDQGAAVQVGQLDRGVDAADRRFGLSRGVPSPLGAAAELSGERTEAPLDGSVGDVVEDDRVAGPRRHLGDAGAHRASADDADHGVTKRPHGSRSGHGFAYSPMNWAARFSRNAVTPSL